MKLVEVYKFPSLFINQFYPRPGTPAARMKRIDTAKVCPSSCIWWYFMVLLSFLFFFPDEGTRSKRW